MLTPSPPFAPAPLAPPQAAISLRLLGTAAWRVPGQPWRNLASKDATLLARLALDGPQPRSLVASWLWPDVAQARASANLRQRLFRLRHLCGELVIETDAGLRLADAVQSDVWRDGCSNDADFAAPLLRGVGTADGAHEPGQDWLDEARRLWAARGADVLGGLAARLEGQGALAAALAATEQLLATEPLLEHAWRRLMRLHTQRGDRAAALAAFERCEQVLQDELGVKPAPETQALLHRVESGQGAVADADTAVNLPAVLLNPPQLVGRQVELRAMAAAWQAGRAFVLLGEAGMGKSRLLLSTAAEGPARVLAAARPGDEAVAFGSLVRLLRSMARVAPAPQRLWPDPALRQELSRLMPELGPVPTSPGHQAALHNALEQVFLAAPAAGLRALLFDDLQHCDEASRAVLQRVCGLPQLLWGFASRPAVGAEAWLTAWLASSSRLQPVALAALDDSALAALLVGVQLAAPESDSASPAPTAALHAALARHCGGNPLFVLETLKHLHLRGDLAAWACAGPAPLSPLPLPPSVHAVLTQRLAGLSERAQNLARVAAVAGSEFSVTVAADVMAESPLAVAAPWAELERAQIFRQQPGAQVFAHESALDAVRSSLPQALLVPLHAGVALSLQKSAAPPGTVARHFAAAGQPGLAAPMAVAAAAQAMHQGHIAEQLAFLQQAAQCYELSGQPAAAFDTRVDSLPITLVHQGVGPAAALAALLLPQASSAAQRLALHLEQANVALAGQDIALLQSASQAALEDAPPGTPAALRAQALNATALAFRGYAAEALAAIAAVQRGLLGISDPRLAAELEGHSAMVFSTCGRTRDCVKALQQQLHHARQAGDVEQEAIALASMAGQHINLGECEEALRSAQQAARLYLRLGSAGTAFANDLNRATSLAALNRYGAAQELLDAAGLHCQRAAASIDLQHIVAEQRAALLVRLGDVAGALKELDEVPAPQLPRRQIQQLMLRAQLALMQGQEQAARACWSAMQTHLVGAGDTVLSLCARAVASQALPADAAQLQLDGVMAAATKAEFPSAQAQVWMARARRALAAGQNADALAHAQQLWALRTRARHLLLDEGQLCAVICEVADAYVQGHAKAHTDPNAHTNAQTHARSKTRAGAPAEIARARQLRQSAVQAFVLEAQAHVPPAHRARWQAHPLRLALWADSPG